MDRWREEFTLIVHEMEWSVRFFRGRSHKWEELKNNADSAGKVCYAARQQHMWGEFAQQAYSAFQKEVPGFKID